MVDIYYKVNPTNHRFTNLTRNMFWPQDDPLLGEEGNCQGNKVKFPHLKGKGAEIRALMPALEWAWGMNMDSGNAQHKAVLVALQCSVFLDKTLDEHRDEDVLPKTASE